MTIRVPAQVQNIDSQKLAAVLTRAVLNPTLADTLADTHVGSHGERMGQAWIHWGEAQNQPKKVRHPLD